MNEAMFEKWKPAALALQADQIVPSRVPMPVTLREAVDVAAFLKRWFEPSVSEGINLPGLKGLAREGRVTESTQREVLELRDALDTAHVAYLFALDPPKVDLMRKSEQLLGEITAWLDYLFDDGEQTVEDGQLERLAREYATPQSHDVMAAALIGYAGLANQHRERLANIGFDVTQLDQASIMAAQLRERSASADRAKTAAALDLRDRLASLLMTRINSVRAAARLVFRAHPRIIREATSAYQRRRVAAARRASAKGAPAEAPLVVGG